MVRSKRGWWIAGAIALTGWGAWHAGAWLLGGDGADGNKIVNQLWVERLPKSDRDQIRHLVIIERRRRRLGVEGRSSQWKHDVEVFQWKLDGGDLELYFPQTGTKATRRVRVWKCAGEAPKPFELCLEIRDDKTKQLLYSREDWVIDPDAAASSAAAIVAHEPELGRVVDREIAQASSP
jgi:hypothetical protein